MHLAVPARREGQCDALINNVMYDVDNVSNESIPYCDCQPSIKRADRMMTTITESQPRNDYRLPYEGNDFNEWSEYFAISRGITIEPSAT